MPTLCGIVDALDGCNRCVIHGARCFLDRTRSRAIEMDNYTACAIMLPTNTPYYDFEGLLVTLVLADNVE